MQAPHKNTRNCTCHRCFPCPCYVEWSPLQAGRQGDAEGVQEGQPHGAAGRQARDPGGGAHRHAQAQERPLEPPGAGGPLGLERRPGAAVGRGGGAQRPASASAAWQLITFRDCSCVSAVHCECREPSSWLQRAVCSVCPCFATSVSYGRAYAGLCLEQCRHPTVCCCAACEGSVRWLLV